MDSGGEEMKPGYKTTEFWLAILAMAVGAIYDSGAFVKGSVAYQGLGIVAGVLSSIGYSVSRGLAKKQ